MTFEPFLRQLWSHAHTKVGLKALKLARNMECGCRASSLEMYGEGQFVYYSSRGRRFHRSNKVEQKPVDTPLGDASK